ncbi:hypothetical protein GDO86_013767 [Hymenochirus boettgeri]|uniref:Uncharacterized protein n=1 Tax=Hymenochirus boettgeri TaxID=247094 RepID=A0A8T2JL73_9PIPI|nr:hypothetical protein GDO86_013767 [Hymenochirus boettgeri]
MTKCIVKGCSNTTQKNSGVTLHGFPNSLDAIKLWLQQTGNDFGDLDAFARRVLDSRSRWIYRMCSKHFSPQSYYWSGKKLILKPDAVPTIFPGKMNRYIMEDVLGFTRSESAQVEMQLQLDTITQQHGGHHPTLMCKCQAEATQANNTEIPNKEEAKTSDKSAINKVMVDKSTNTDPMVGRADKGTLWPEFEYNFDGEPWKIKHDHFYPHIRFLKDPRKRGQTYKENNDFWCINDYESIKKSFNHKHGYPVTDTPYIFIERDYFDTDMIPVKSGDVAVFFSKEEWEYIDQHRKNYQDLLPEEPPFNKFRLSESSNADNPTENATTDVTSSSCAKDSPTEDFTQGMLIKEDGLYTALSPDPSPVRQSDLIKEEYEEVLVSDKSAGDYTHRYMDYSSGEIKEETEEFIVTRREMNLCTEQNVDCISDGFCTEQSYRQRLIVQNETAASQSTGEQNFVEDVNDGFSCSRVPAARPGTVKSLEGKKRPVRNDNRVFNGKGDDPRLSDLEHPINDGARPRQCRECSAWFPDQFQLSLHLKTHTVKKLLKCPTCGKGYKFLSRLITHQKSHKVKDRIYTCLVCQVQYEQKCQFAAHMRIHPGEKPYMCDECGKCFAQKGSLVLHQKKHKGLSAYKCKQCGKQFDKRSKLVNHVKFHRIEKQSTG